MNQYALYARKSQEDEGRQQQSIPDQVRIMTEMAERLGLQVTTTLREEKSAKEPYQRPVFDDIIRMVQEGELDSILCYHVNRLARNMVEGGLLQHLLTKGKLREIRTFSEVFRSGDNILPFILQTAMSTQYSLDLSVTVKRGLSSKVLQGDFPHWAPEGYLNDRYEATIVADPDRFSLLRKAWELMLTGSYSLERLVDVMNDDWGYRTRKTRKQGGIPINKSLLYRCLNNVFYTGHFLYKGELHKGNHPAMVTFEEFDAVQKILRRYGRRRPKTWEFAYTGMIECARCGRQVTAEHKSGRGGAFSYTYYHCTEYRKCRAKAVRQEVIEEQVERLLRAVSIKPQFKYLAVQAIERAYAEESARDSEQDGQRKQSLEEAQRQMGRLIQMSLKELISDEEFQQERRTLQEQINGLKKATEATDTALERAKSGSLEVVEFATRAPYEFLCGSVQRKREIARALAIRYVLREGKLEAELHPLLAPLAEDPTESPKTGSGKVNKGYFLETVACGGDPITMLESLRIIWKLLIIGAEPLLDSGPNNKITHKNMKGKAA